MRCSIGLALGVWCVVFVANCASDYPYPAPYGAELVINPDEYQVNSDGMIAVFDVAVWNPTTETFLNNIMVKVISAYTGVILVPETAILSYNDKTDSDWQVQAGEYYYQLTNVAIDDIQPNYLETTTDYRGVATVYAYLRCLPMLCGVEVADSCEVEIAKADGSDEYDACKYAETRLYFSIGVDSTEAIITAKSQ